MRTPSGESPPPRKTLLSLRDVVFIYAWDVEVRFGLALGIFASTFGCLRSIYHMGAAAWFIFGVCIQFLTPNWAACGSCGCSFLHFGRLDAISGDVEVRFRGRDGHLGVETGLLGVPAGAILIILRF